MVFQSLAFRCPAREVLTIMCCTSLQVRNGLWNRGKTKPQIRHFTRSYKLKSIQSKITLVYLLYFPSLHSFHSCSSFTENLYEIIYTTGRFATSRLKQYMIIFCYIKLKERCMSTFHTEEIFMTTNYCILMSAKEKKSNFWLAEKLY